MALEEAVQKARKDIAAQAEQAELDKTLALEKARGESLAEMKRIEAEHTKAVEEARRETLEEVTRTAAEEAARVAQERRQALRGGVSVMKVEATELKPEYIDKLLVRIEDTLHKNEEMAEKGSHVRRRQAEVELMSLLEAARDFMTSLLRRDVTGRGLLEDIFGGDCCRISCLRAMLEAVRVSETSAEDQRLPMCIRACMS